MSTGVVVLLVAVVAAMAFGAFRAATDGRFHGTRAAAGSEDEVPDRHDESVLVGTPWVDDLGERATLLQFSSAFCAPCRATRRVLEDVTNATRGVAHLEVDAEQHLDVVRRLGILRTPTTLVLDSAGREVTRASGAPTKEQVLTALTGAVAS